MKITPELIELLEKIEREHPSPMRREVVAEGIIYFTPLVARGG